MGKFIKGATSEEKQAFIEQHKKKQFLGLSQSYVWASVADRHKRAANILYEVAHAANDRELARSLEHFKRTSAKMRERGLSSWSEPARALEGEELHDDLDSELLSEYLLLAGYALECILKGCLLAKEPELVKDGEELSKKIINHRIADLCCNCGISLSPSEEELVDTIYKIVWWRKYPVPKDWNEMPNPFSQSSSCFAGSPFHNRQYQTCVDGLYQRGCDLLLELRKGK